MSRRRRSFALAGALLLAAATARAEGEPAQDWEYSFSGWAYFVPDDDDYLQPTVTADRGRLHLEGRYNYEAEDTGSLWAGYNFGGGDELEWSFTPIGGGVFGETDAIAAGYEASLAWKKFELYTEGEYVIDDAEGSFFYSWSEASFWPLEWLRFGLAAQRTRAYESEREIGRGIFAGLYFAPLDVTCYVLDPDADDPTVILAAGVSF
jgi:hypothetical protein